MAFCTACGGSVESNHDYCYPCGSRIEHPQPVIEAAPEGDTEPVEHAPQVDESAVIEAGEVEEIPKNQSKRRFDWRWIGSEIALFPVAILVLSATAYYAQSEFGAMLGFGLVAAGVVALDYYMAMHRASETSWLRDHDPLRKPPAPP